MPDALAWRSAWTTLRRGSNARPSRWCVNWIDDQGHARRLCYKSRALMLRAKQLKETEINSWCRPPGLRTWAELIEEYGLALADRSASHQAKVARVLDRFWEICRPAQSNLVTPATCEAFLAARSRGEPPQPARRKPAQGQPPAMIRRVPAAATRAVEWQMLADFFTWCVHRAYMPANPIRHVRRPSTPHRRRSAPRPAHWVAVLHSIADPSVALDDRQAWHLIVLLGVLTGYRQSVLLNSYFGVRPDDQAALRHLEHQHPRGYCIIHLAGAEEQIGLLFTYTGKTRKEDLAGLAPVLNDRLAQRIAALPSGTQRLLPWTRWPRKAWERITRHAHLPSLTFQSLRAACGTAAAVARARETARRQLDHADARVTTDHYLDPEQLATALAMQASLPPLPPLPPYAPQRVPRGAARGLDTTPSGPPARTAAPAASAASSPAC